VARDGSEIGDGGGIDPERPNPDRNAGGAPAVALLAGWRQRAERALGLPGKLLLLTSLFVMLAEILIFVPSLANFRTNWLADRINAAHLAALASEAVPGGAVPPMLRMELLSNAQVKGIAIKRMGQRRMVLPPDDELRIDATFDLRPMSNTFGDMVGDRVALISDAMSAFAMPQSWVIRVLGQPRGAGGNTIATPFAYGREDFVEILLPSEPLRAAMKQYALNILALSIIISVITAAMVYWALNRLLVQPMMGLATNMVHFSAKPEDASRIMVPSNREDEVGIIERGLAQMQTELVQLLQQKNRLAQLGLAVSKINHDLRNMLGTAQLMSDRLAALPDPAVQQFSPKLIASLDRAISFCNETLSFGRAGEKAPQRSRFKLRELIDDVGDGLGLPNQKVGWQIDADDQLEIDADREHLFRILNNLIRNAVQVLESAPQPTGDITVRAVRMGRAVRIEVADNGPGVPEAALANLFQAFKGGARKGGSGLGLAIAAELVAVHGGTLQHVAGRPGAIFVLEIADRQTAN
jgi:signal transduction histidine kinase